MEVSNIKVYSFKHASSNEDPIEVPKDNYPSSVVISDNLVSKSWNNMYGEFKDIPVNLKTKIIWKFDAIREDFLEEMYGKMRADILQYKSRFFYINTFFPGVGYVKGLYYLGTPTTFNSLDAGGFKGSIKWFSGEIHWIEVDGVRLNDPTQNNPNNL
jgi:hypothetical protein